jgi:phosphoglycerate kinase
MGVYEQGYTHGTDALAGALAASAAHAVIGGGDTVAAVSKFAFDPSKIFISSGGGAMLEFLANGTLPAIEALKKA